MIALDSALELPILYNSANATIWRKAMRPILLLLIALILIFSIAYSDHRKQLDIRTLEGDWKGNGEFLVPVTGIRADIEGYATFAYNDIDDYLRTALTAEKFMFSYSDSGHLVHDTKTDSISWEVWDNFGKHALYHGKVEGNLVKGDRQRKDKIYSVTIEFVNRDSIDFRLITTDPEDNESVDRATFHLWRLKK